MNTKLHAICDSQGRPLNLIVTAGQVSDYIGARALLSSLPDVDWLLGDRGYCSLCRWAHSLDLSSCGGIACAAGLPDRFIGCSQGAIQSRCEAGCHLSGPLC
jgi:hypothetical protein